MATGMWNSLRQGCGTHRVAGWQNTRAEVYMYVCRARARKYICRVRFRNRPQKPVRRVGLT
eukprot:6712981-Prymnesium_polylepis.1